MWRRAAAHIVVGAVTEEDSDFTLQIPPELEGGVYANFLSGWFTAHEFTLDFCVAQPGLPYPLASRVKLPVTMILEVLQGLSLLMSAYEARFGEIQRPEPREEA